MDRKTFLRVLAFLAVLFACDRCFYLGLHMLFQRTETGEAGGNVNKARREQAQVVILGSSRAVHHYVPRILQEALQASVYNAAANGQGLPYMNGLMDLLLHDYSPKLFILNVDAVTIVSSQGRLDRVAALAPFIDDSPVIRSMLYQRGRFEPLKYLSLSFRFNGKPLAIVKNLFTQDTSPAGFEPLKGVLDPTKYTDDPGVGAKPDAALIMMLREMINRARTKGVRVVLVNSPFWRSDHAIAPNKKKLLGMVQQIAAAEQIPAISINQENDHRFHNPGLFYDPGHLNEKGAELFTNVLIKKLAELGYVPLE